MTTVLLVIHLILTIALVAVVLLQRSEGGALGIGGGGGGGLMTGRSAANLLTRTTGFLAGGFMVTSLVLSLIANQQREPTSILDTPAAEPAPISAPATPEAPAVPAPPMAQ